MLYASGRLGSLGAYMANRNWANAGRLYGMHVKPVLVDCKFTVDQANTNGLGITSLKGPTVSNVFMNSSAATPSSLPSANPEAGTIVLQLQDNYQQLLSFRHAITAPSSGSDVKIDNSALTVGRAYTITTLGNATAAKWHAIGVPAGITPAVGVSFIAKTNGGTGNVLTSKVQTTATNGSGVASIELVPQSSADIAPSPTAGQGFGAQFIVQCFDYAGAKVQPADGSVIHLEMYLSDSSVLTQGE